MLRNLRLHPEKAPKSATNLVESERVLLDAIRLVGTGRIEHMTVIDGQAILRTIALVHDVKLGESNQIRAIDQQEFVLTKEAAHLIAVLRDLKRATVRRIEIRHGSPILLQVEDHLLSAESGDSSQAE